MAEWKSGPEGHVPCVAPGEAVALQTEGALLLDVREAHEWEAGHAPGVHHLPLGSVAARLDTLSMATRIVVVCRSGRRSAAATALLLQSGFDAVNLEGGMVAWHAAGLEVRTPGGGTGQVA